MRVIRTTGTPRHSASISPAALVLAKIIASAAYPWTSQALCAQTDPDLFFSENADDIAQAKTICGRCDVRVECLSQALDTGEPAGVWGRHDPDERRKLLRRRDSSTSRPAGAA
jgi:WhiB family transcriptional regulator, redox-sensing transcriptional regulator